MGATVELRWDIFGGRKLTRFPNAAAVDLARAHLYRAELAVRTNNHELAQSSLATANSLPLTDNEKASLADEFTRVAELLNQE